MAQASYAQVDYYVTRYVLVWNQYTLDDKYSKYKDRIMSHDQFMSFEVTQPLLDELEKRMKKQSAGSCISLVYATT